MTAETKPLLEVRGLTRRFDVRASLLRRESVCAVREVSFVVHRGESVALVGESGSGKSTTARMIAQLLAPSEGQILLDGVPATRSLGYRRRVQMIFQDPFSSLNPVHRVGYHIARPLLRHRLATDRHDAARRTRTLLETVGLAPGADVARRYPHELSGGQRQRVAIARALAVEPDLILADEPTSMLDVSVRIGVLNLLRDLKQRRGIAFVYITHDLASARYFADRTMVMKDGEIVEQGPSARVMDAPEHAYTRLLLAAVPDPTVEIEAPLPR